MDTDAVFAHIADQRRALADLVETLDDAQLATPSLCGEWDVRTVAAHLTVLFSVKPQAFLLAMLRARGDFDRANDALSRKAARMSPTEIAALLRRRAESRATPPVGGPRAPLTDLLVHGGDLRIPLGIAFEPPIEAVETSLGFLSEAGKGFIPRGRLRGIRLAPTDTSARWGEGAELTGRGIDLLMAVTGRRGTLDRVAGPGRDVLAARV